MRVHHLDCCPMHPVGKRLINGSGGYFEPADLVTHCLLIEVDGGLVLVDTGLGRKDLDDPSRQGAMVNWTMNPQREPDPTALTKIRKLGYDPEDVKHILVTHLDMDHAGGLADFPEATIHLLEAEYKVAHSPPLMQRIRYRANLWDYDPDWAKHSPGSDSLFGFEAVKPLAGEVPELRMVSLPGHTAGHAGVALETSDGWLFHCGDAYFDHREMRAESPTCTPGLKLQQWMLADDNRARLETQRQLRALNQREEDVELFCSHSPEEFDRYRSE